MRKPAVLVLTIVSLLAGGGLLFAADTAKDEAIKKEHKALKGTWKLTYLEVDGKKTSEEELKHLTLIHDEGGKFSLHRGDKVITEATVKFDPTKRPKTTDATYTVGVNKGKTALGIYKSEGEFFHVCTARPGAARPTTFSAKAGSGHTLMKYKRVK